MRLIDADVLADNAYEIYVHASPEFKERMITLKMLIDNAPTLDAVQVVKCKDCKHRGGYHCPMYHTETSLDDLEGFDEYNVDKTDGDGFCHRGERREQNESE